jgi:purine-nucleoside phosphorylase
VTDYERVNAAADAVRVRVPRQPLVGVVLGSGLRTFADAPSRATSIPYDAIPYWPLPTVEGHEGRLVAGSVNDRFVIVLSGRSHGYEGCDPDSVTFGIRVLGLLGVRTVVLTNAAGGINPRFAPGSLVVIDDHVNLSGSNPLVGPNEDRFGPRFPDMSEVYSRRLRELAAEAAASLDLGVDHGVYAYVSGPSYETPAEIRFLRTAGADLVGMSTVPEAIVARHMGLQVLAISCVSNAAAGLHASPLDHRDVLAVTEGAAGRCAALIAAVIARL